MNLPNHLDADRFSVLGDTPLLLIDARDWAPPHAPIQSVIVGCDRAGALPDCDPAHFDLLLTTALEAPSPWVSLAPPAFDTSCAMIKEAVREWPVAATILCQTLRLAGQRPIAEALAIESLAYSTLLGGSEFRRWQKAQPIAAIVEPSELIIALREGDHITLSLNNPEQQNAMTAAMRDALYGALSNVLDDPTCPTVSLRGAGKCFSTGGSLAEFGTADDLAQAHCIRTLHSSARLIEALGDRIDVHFHGACVGSGLEVPAAAARRTANPDAWFQLPELRMGLIPGAGGTATVARIIGRHRTGWMVLSGKRINVVQALKWGLIDEICAP